MNLVPTILANYPDKHRRQGKSLVCRSCSPSTTETAGSSSTAEPPAPLHSQSHLLSGECAAVNDLLIDCDPRDDKSLALFFRRVVARNMEIDEAEEN